MSIATKLHMLLLTTILGVGLYMFLLYKEIKLFEHDIAELSLKVHTLQSQMPIMNIDIVEPAAKCPIAKINAAHVLTQADVNVTALNDDADEDQSVSSDEIKEILTNIQDFTDVSEVITVPVTATATTAPSATTATATPVAPPAEITIKTIPDLANIPIEEIPSLRYDDIRSLLRKHGVSNPKGTKPDLVAVLVDIKNKL
jgi:hypothetical protein